MARHLPLDRREDAAPPCRAGRAAVATSRSSTPTISCACSSSSSSPPTSTRSAGPRAQLAGLIDRLEEQGAGPRRHRCRRERSATPTAAAASSTRTIRTRLKALNACDFGDLLLHMLVILTHAPRRAGAVSAALPLHHGRRISGHQQRPVSLAAAARAGAQEHLLRRRRRPVDLFVARRARSRTSCSSRRIFPARRSSGSNRITARPRTSSPPPRA